MPFLLSEDPTPEWEKQVPTQIKLNEIHAWKSHLKDWAGEEKRCYACLSEVEKGRARRISFDHLRQRFIIAHGVVREILGMYLRQLPIDVEINSSPSEKPTLTGPSARVEPGLRFNYSHSEDLLLLAISQENELGVDVERIRPEIDHFVIARHFFAAEERSWLQSLSSRDQVEAFYRLWICKEAALKAEGSGLRQSLEAVKIEFVPGEKATCGSWQAKAAIGDRAWAIQIVRPDAEYAAALAVSLDASAAQLPEIKYFRYQAV